MTSILEQPFVMIDILILFVGSTVHDALQLCLVDLVAVALTLLF